MKKIITLVFIFANVETVFHHIYKLDIDDKRE